MDHYKALKRETIKVARRHPVSFLRAHLGETDALGGHSFATSLRYVPVLMRLTNDDHISLSVTEWDDEMSAYVERTSTAHSTPVESGELLWEFDGNTWKRGDLILDEASQFIPAITVAHALSDWEDLVYRLDARKGPEEHAWFFPFGLESASKQPGLMMYASNRN